MKCRKLFLLGLMSVLAIDSCLAQHSGLFNRRIVRQTIRNNVEFHRMEVKGVRFQMGMNDWNLPYVKGNLVFIRDSAVLLSIIPAFGIEAGRILITRDSLFVVNRLQRYFTKEDWKELGLDLDQRVKLKDVQDIMMGNLPRKARWILRSNKKMESAGPGVRGFIIKVGSEESEYPVLLIDEKLKKISSILVNRDNYKFSLVYNYKMNDEGNTFLSEVRINGNYHREKVDGSIKLGILEKDYRGQPAIQVGNGYSFLDWTAFKSKLLKLGE